MNAPAQPAASPPLAGDEGCTAHDPARDAGLDALLLAAHAAADEQALARLYARAADAAETRGDVDAACFFLTHAYVFALSSGAADAGALHARLLAHGREE
jgi:hypothetical protein